MLNISTKDQREQLANERSTGTFAQVQLPLERITQLHGIMFDLDPDLYVAGNPYFLPADDPRAFFHNIESVLDRHPLARAAEVRSSGRGLHVIVWLDPAPQLRSEAEQHYWDAIVKVVQRTLPVDPRMPGVTALTRPLGSINGKNGALVETLKSGTPVDPSVVMEFMRRLTLAPFKEIAGVLFGAQRVEPCPACQADGSRMGVLDRVGKCYERCGTVKLSEVFDAIFRPRDAGPKTERKTKATKAVESTEAKIND